MERSKKPAAPPVHPLDASFPAAAPRNERRKPRGARAAADRHCAALPPGQAAALGERAVDCVLAYVVADREAVVHSSVDFLEEWVRVLSACGVDRRDVYRELDHRLQLSSLLLKLNREDAEALAVQGGRRRAWRPATTKLP